MKPQCKTLLEALKRGEKLTALDALRHYGVMACSQRMGEIIREGYPVKSKLIPTAKGKYVSLYWL